MMVDALKIATIMRELKRGASPEDLAQRFSLTPCEILKMVAPFQDEE